MEYKVALITGASSGLGAETAVHFANLGFQMTLVGLSREHLELTAQRSVQAGLEPDDMLLVVADLTNDIETTSLVEQTLAKFGRLDVLVNCAGITRLGPLPHHSMVDFDAVMNVNVRAAFNLTQLAIPHLAKTQGSIVNVSSVCGSKAVIGSAAYNMSKAALEHFTRCAALELASKKIRVNAVSPGYVKTEILRRSGLNQDKVDRIYEKVLKEHPIGRLGTGEDVAKAIAFLANNDEASFMTGVILPVDGGFLL